MDLVYLSREAEKTVDDVIASLDGATIEGNHSSGKGIALSIGKGKSYCHYRKRQNRLVAFLSVDNDVDAFDEEERAIHYTNRLFVLSVAVQSEKFPLVLLKQLEEADLPLFVKSAIRKNPKYF